MPKKREFKTIPRKWFSLAPGMGLPFWSRVYDAAKERGVSKTDYERLKEIIKEKRDG